MTHIRQFVLFDCDGVIVDSNPLKTRAFQETLSEYNEPDVAALLEYHRIHGGLSRVHKFRYFFQEICLFDKDTVTELIKQKSNQFNQYCRQHFPSLKLTDGFLRYIHHLHRLEIPCFIVSGGNTDEISLMLNSHNMAHLFHGIFGNEQSKVDAVNNILTTHNFAPEDGMLFGDSALDGETANQYHIPFIFVSEYSDVTVEDLAGVSIDKVIRNFTEMLT